VLAAVGQQKGWPHILHMLQAKEAPYYPLAVTVLGALPTQESISFVTTALVGEEEEQLAAMQSIHVFPASRIEPALFAILRDDNRRTSVRVQAMRMLTARRSDRLPPELRALAMQLDGGDPLLKVEAMMSLPAFGQLHTFDAREAIRQRITSDEEDVARAARAALVSYMLNLK